MRPRLFIAILALLLCTIAAHGEKPIVIKDSEAIKDVGKEVEVASRTLAIFFFGSLTLIVSALSA
jgi:hypothetical protein